MDDKKLLVDPALFAKAVEGVLEGLQKTGRTLPPAKMAELFIAAYELIAEEAANPDGGSE